MGRPNKELLIGEAYRLRSRAPISSRIISHSLVPRAQTVLLSGEGQINREVALRRLVPLARALSGEMTCSVCTTN